MSYIYIVFSYIDEVTPANFHNVDVFPNRKEAIMFAKHMQSAGLLTRIRRDYKKRGGCCYHCGVFI